GARPAAVLADEERVEAYVFAGEGVVGCPIVAGSTEVERAHHRVSSEVGTEGRARMLPTALDARRVDVDGGRDAVVPAVAVGGVGGVAAEGAGGGRAGGSRGGRPAPLVRVAGAGAGGRGAPVRGGGFVGAGAGAHKARGGADPPQAPEFAAGRTDVQGGDP